MAGNGMSRRDMLRAGAAGVAASALPLVNVHGQTSGGRVSIGFWDHWVPTGNDAMRKIVNEWAQKNRVDVQMDFITSVGNKNLLTIAAEAQAKQGHDILAFPTWEVHSQQQNLEPVDDVIGGLIKEYGPINEVTEYLAKIGGKWLALPATAGSQYKGSAARIDLLKQHAGIDPPTMYPAETHLGPGAEDWTWDHFLQAAQKCNAVGHPFGLPAGTFSDATDWIGGMFRAYGAEMVNAKGDITLRNNDKVKQVLDYAGRLFAQLPADVFSWDDASNNRSLISGKAALIFNPPSAWAVAKRDAPQVAEQVWHYPAPGGPDGRFTPFLPYFWGIWNFSKNKQTAKALLTHLSQREQVAQMVAASDGYDIPPFASLTDLDTWSIVGPPKGTVFNYPLRPHHKARPSVAYAPAPAEIAVQMYNQGVQAKMIARIVQNKEPVDRVLAWAEQEIEGYKRG